MAPYLPPAATAPRGRRAPALRRWAAAACIVAVAGASAAPGARIVGLLEPLEPEPRAIRPGSGATREDFRRFADRWLGGWDCRLREWDGDSPEPVWEASQRRTFSLRLQGSFLEEAAFVLDSSGWVQSGIHLFSFDPDHGRILQSGFWSQSPGRLFAVDAVLVPRRLALEGTMTLRLPGGSVEKRRIQTAFEGADRAVYRVYRQRPDGSEYLHEELLYTRREGA